MTHKRKGALVAAAAQRLDADDGERIEFFRGRLWIGYPKARAVLAKLERLYDYPEVTRPPNLLVVTETNNGKTSIVERFKELHPDVDDPLSDGVKMPVVLLDTPPSGDEERLYAHILKKLRPTTRVPNGKDAKLIQVERLLQGLQVRVLILDEFNNSLTGQANQRQQMYNALKGLSNGLRRPIVLTGTYQALTALRSDPQLQNRFPPMVLPKWELNRDYLQLLTSFEALMPLRRGSGLASEQLAPLLLSMSNRNIGELKNLLVLAFEEAVISGEERITAKLLLRLDWLPPDLRDQAASAAEYGMDVKLDYQARIRELGAVSEDETDDESDGDDR